MGACIQSEVLAFRQPEEGCSTEFDMDSMCFYRCNVSLYVSVCVLRVAST